MRIISSFKDFWDGAGAIDPSFHYVRNPHVVNDTDIESKFTFPPQSWTMSKNGTTENYKFVYIFFCGEIFCGIGRRDIWYYGDAAREKFVCKSDYFGKSERFFGNHGKSCHAINLKHNSPIVVFEDGGSWNSVTRKWQKKGIQVDGPLGLYGFASVIDPFQARQCVETYLRNNLAKDIDIKPITDRVKIQAHGYNEWSFRNPLPPKRKRKE